MIIGEVRYEGGERGMSVSAYENGNVAFGLSGDGSDGEMTPAVARALAAMFIAAADAAEKPRRGR